MSENVAVTATSDDGPSDAAMSNCTTPLNILVKIERIESDDEESGQIEINIEPEPSKEASEPSVPMTWISKEASEPSVPMTCISKEASELSVPMTWISKEASVYGRELQVKLTRLPLFLLKLFTEDANATAATPQQVEENDKSELGQLSDPEPDFQSKFRLAFSRLLPPSFQHKPVIKEDSQSTNKVKLETNGTSQTPNTQYKNENNYQGSNRNMNLECQSKKMHFAKKYPCTICKYVTHIESVYKKHLLAHSARNQYVCEICSYIATRKRILMIHLSMHSGEKNYSCDICNRKFIVGSDLYRHVKTHTNKKPYACKICHKKFKQHRYLKVHAQFHTGERPYACEMCDKKFALRCNLNLHMRTHTGDKPYACNMCDKKFSHHGVLKNHVRTHTGERPYACKICGKTIADRGNFTKHLQAHVGKKYYLYLKQ